MIAAIVTVVAGALFGFGLALSGMVRPEVVLSFLQFQDLIVVIKGRLVGELLLGFAGGLRQVEQGLIAHAAPAVVVGQALNFSRLHYL